MLILTPPGPSRFKVWFPPYDEVLAKTGGEDPNPAQREQRAVILQDAFERFAIEGPTTADELDTANPRKRLDLYGESLAYLRVAVYGFFRYNRLNWCKSRKTLATITLTELLTWCCHMWALQRWGWITQKEADAMDLVEQYVKDAYIASMPKWWKQKWTYGRVKGHLVVKLRDGEPWGSTIIAYPQGADQTRQFAHSGMVIDEAHTFVDLLTLIQAIAPGLTGRDPRNTGKLVLAGVARRGSQFASLLGRYRELATQLAVERLTEPHSELSSLTAPGGAGVQ